MGIEDNETLIRYIKPIHLSRGGKVSNEALLLRRLPSGIDENYLSLMRKGYRDYIPSLQVSPIKSPAGYLSFLAIECRNAEKPATIKVELLPKPTKGFPAHAGLYVYQKDKVVTGICYDEDYLSFIDSLLDSCTFTKF
ncbi:MAG: hypothetical protein LUD17_03485 [Bacteroidales bacterium]|nr:hypothetical protein [Bacteroidales bacterium]